MNKMNELKEELVSLLNECKLMPYSKWQSTVRRLIEICDDLGCQYCIEEVATREEVANAVQNELDKYGENSLIHIKCMLEGLSNPDSNFLYRDGNGNYKEIATAELDLLITNVLEYVDGIQNTGDVSAPAWKE